jgi:hypothetical protein
VRLRLLAVAAVVALAAGLAACGGSDTAGPPNMALRSTGTDWILGQPSLRDSAGYDRIIRRAALLARVREAARLRELQRLERARKLAKKRAREDQLRRIRELRRRALAAYRLALRQAAEARRRQQEKLARLREERARKLRELLKKLEVTPGAECDIPEVRRQFACEKGRLPFGTKK